MTEEKVEVAVATADGKAYFNLVEELKRRKIRYISLKPTDPIPLKIRMVITTPEETPSIRHGKVIAYSSIENAEKAVDQALKTLQRRETTQVLTVGVDVGKTSGLAILADGDLLHTGNYTTPEGPIDAIEETVHNLKPKEVIIKLGRSGYRHRVDAASGRYLDWTEELRKNLSKRLGDTVKVILVDERDTTTLAKRLKVKRGERDKTSALEIALR